MITALLLAGGIAASIPAAVDKVLLRADCNSCVPFGGGMLCTALACETIPATVDKPLAQLPEEERLSARLMALEIRVARNERIRDDLVGCTVESLIGTGGDLLFTGLAWDRCPTCKESNPLGVNEDARAGMKFGQTGVELGLCLLAAKHRHKPGSEGDHRHGKWFSRAIRAAIILNNAYATFAKRPLISWGVKRGAP